MGQNLSTLAPDGEDPRTFSARESWMKSACHSALASVQHAHGGPFGAAVVHTKTGRILSCSHNTVLLDKNPTRHAEMNAIREAAAAMRGRVLPNEKHAADVFAECEMFTTCEPCPMCLGAIHRCNFQKVHIGVDRKCAAKYGFDDLVFYQEVAGIAGRLDLAKNNSSARSEFLTLVLAPGGTTTSGGGAGSSPGANNHGLLGRGGVDIKFGTVSPKTVSPKTPAGGVSEASTSASFSGLGGLVLQTKIGVGFLLSPEAKQLTILQDMLGMEEVRTNFVVFLGD